MNGTIFNIQKFCVNDGPGIRTTVFLKGCPLRCAWCHNPESQVADSEIMFYKDKCVSCGRCVSLCKMGCHTLQNGVHMFDSGNCSRCFKCVEIGCGALEKAGQSISSEEVIDEVLKDKIFYDNSGGGITLSGGEPLFQINFALDLLKRAKELGLHTVIETCGFTSEKNMKKAAEFVDLFLFDYKETDSRLHKEFTGVDNSVILKNLELLDSLKKKIILRCPVIPGYNDRQEHFKGICSVANRFDSILHIELEPYHSFGEGKYSSLGRKSLNAVMPSEEEKNSWITEIKKNTCKEVRFA